MNSEYKVCGFRPMNGGAAVAFSRMDSDATVAIFIADGASADSIVHDIRLGLDGLKGWIAETQAVVCG